MARAKKPASGPVRIGPINLSTISKTLRSDKYEMVKAALLKVLPRDPPGITQSEMLASMKKQLPQDVFPRGPTSEWWTKSVQLDLEAKGLVQRDESVRPLRWWRAR